MKHHRQRYNFFRKHSVQGAIVGGSLLLLVAGGTTAILLRSYQQPASQAPKTASTHDPLEASLAVLKHFADLVKGGKPPKLAQTSSGAKSGAAGGGALASACPAFPSFPDASCTGYAHTGATLTKVPLQATSGTGWRWNGSTVVATASNITISGLDVSGGVDTTSHTGVTIKNSWVRCTGISDWCISIGSGSSVIDTEVGGGESGTAYSQATGIFTGGPGNQLLRVHVHGTSDGLRTDGGTTITDCYIHDLSWVAFPSAHSDGSQTTASGGPIVFEHNTIQGGNNDAIFLQAGNSVTISHNLLLSQTADGGTTSYGVGGAGVAGPLSITNNRFSKTGFQALPIQRDSWPAGTQISGNAFTDGTLVP